MKNDIFLEAASSQSLLSSLQFLPQIGTNRPSPVTSLPMTLRGHMTALASSASSVGLLSFIIIILSHVGPVLSWGGEQYDYDLELSRQAIPRAGGGCFLLAVFSWLVCFNGKGGREASVPRYPCSVPVNVSSNPSGPFDVTCKLHFCAILAEVS